MKRLVWIVVVWSVLGFSSLSAQTAFQIMFYNVENLFDCYHDTLKHDTEFLPKSLRAWHYGRYKQKIRNIAKVITAVGEWTPPDLVGLCEVENARVMNDLVKYSPLKEQDYRYVMTNSPDERGIDVALLYQRGSFKLLQHRSIRIPFTDPKRRPTRDILHVSGQLITDDTLDVFVCHFPSRSGGEKESEPARLLVAKVLKMTVDSLLEIREHPYLVVMGDFNDYPYNKSITQVLKAEGPTWEVEPKRLYNLFSHRAKRESFGSYKYLGEWGILDQFLVSGTLLAPENSIHTSEGQASICHLPFLLETDEKYSGFRPFRTYYGMKYQGGYSDHLPIVLKLSLGK